MQWVNGPRIGLATNILQNTIFHIPQEMSVMERNDDKGFIFGELFL